MTSTLLRLSIVCFGEEERSLHATPPCGRRPPDAANGGGARAGAARRRGSSGDWRTRGREAASQSELGAADPRRRAARVPAPSPLASPSERQPRTGDARRLLLRARLLDV